MVHHLVREVKLTYWYMLSSRWSSGKHIYAVFWKKSEGNRRRWRLSLLAEAVFTIARLLGGVMWHSVFRDRDKYPYLQNYVYEHTFNLIQHVGFLYERCRNQ
jgi:hypothetical protein